ncbi:hypothetical protein E8E12_001335 [Didymella heteroderae]|uniref:Uncharacterized protein n=1 Tax=Didymella heteroderae TaxID=1769908 RepID=A0A9P4WR05_9PLEO|nr:hypothetical protein E8E12_001335 [Didymella heteroderae]
MFETMHLLIVAALSTLATLIVVNPTFQSHFNIVAAAQAVSYFTFPIVRSVAICMLFGCSIFAALSKVVASLLGTGPLYVALILECLAHLVGAVALTVVVTLVLVGWCTAIHDISQESVSWCKAYLGYQTQQVKEALNDEQTDIRNMVDSALSDPPLCAPGDRTALARGFISGHGSRAQSLPSP